jgi:hypothetical protein
MIDEPGIRTKCFELRGLSYPPAELHADEAKWEREQEGDPPPAGIKTGLTEKESTPPIAMPVPIPIAIVAVCQAAVWPLRAWCAFSRMNTAAMPSSPPAASP